MSLYAINTSPHLFGKDADNFVADRFVRDPAGLQHLKPFGGGQTLCPGRHFARNEIMAFVATILQKFKISILPGQTPAKPLTSGANVGTFGPDQRILATLELRR